MKPNHINGFHIHALLLTTVYSFTLILSNLLATIDSAPEEASRHAEHVEHFLI